MRKMAGILCGAVVAMGFAASAQAQGVTTVVPVSPTENLHRGTTMLPPADWQIKRFGDYQVMETGRKIFFGQEALNRNGMQLPNIHAETYRVAQEVADCLFGSLGDEATAMVPASDDDVIRIVGNACFGQARAGVHKSFLHGAISEAYIKRHDKRYEPRAARVDVDAAEQFSGLVPGVDHDFDMIGRCVAVYSPGLVRDLLETKPGGRDEKKAVDRIYAATPECGLAKSPKRVPSSFQRAAFATGLYQWMHGG